MALAVAALGAGIAAARARADELRTALGQPLREVSHAVDVRVAEGIATYRVRRVFANPGTVADEAGLAIDLPFGAAATGLRIRARKRWYAGELLERGRAADLYQKLTGHGAFAPKDPALLQWLWADKLYLQVFPVLPGRVSTVEYTLTAPIRYQGGHLFLSYPRASAPRADADAPQARRESRPLTAPVLSVQPAWGDASTRIAVDGVYTAPGAPVVLLPAERPAWFDAVEGASDASYAASSLVVPASPRTRQSFARGAVQLAIAHTYRGDLAVDLITPRGERVVVRPRAGGGENGLKGSFPVELPAGTPAAGTWQLVVSDHAALDVGTLDTWSLELGAGADAVRATAADLPLFIADAPETGNDAGLAVIELEPPPIDVVAVRLGAAIASSEHAFGRLELDVAPELRPLPARPAVVFAVDGSHSIGPAGIEAQLEIALGYLSHVPDARAEIVIYRRTAQRLFGALVPAAEVAPRLAAARAAGALDPGNGSALDAAARLAAQILASDGDSSRELRAVLMTDELVRSSLGARDALDSLAALPRAAIAHVVVPRLDDGDAVSLARDDRAPLAALASAHHGVLARVSGLPASTPKALARGVLGLVRPTQLDEVEIEGFDVGDALGDPDGRAVLPEGTGLRAMRLLRRPPERVTLRAKIWGDAFERSAAPVGEFSSATAAWAFSEDEHQELSAAEQMALARLGRAVSPVTSYLAVEPGVRPSTAGLPREERPSPAPGTGFGSGNGNGAGRRERPDLGALLATAARACAEANPAPPGWSVELDVETTRDEVADVALRAGAALPVAACLAEAVWAVRLTDAFDAEREHFALAFP